MGWPSAWKYRKKITVSNASADYQTKVLVGESSGADGEEVDCGGKVAADFDDLRFTASDGTTLLDYWIESITGSSPNGLATVWVQNNATPDTTLYMYYGGTETAVSSGANTFIVFDDFERGSDGDAIGGAWTAETGTPEIDTGLKWGGTRSVLISDEAAYISVTASANIAIRFRYYKPAAGVVWIQCGDGATLCAQRFDDSENYHVYDGASYVDTTKDCLAGSWGIFEARNFDWTAKTLTGELDGEIVTGIDFSFASASYPNQFRLGTQGAVNFDNFLVRKFAATEPSFAFGDEQRKSGFFPFL